MRKAIVIISAAMLLWLGASWLDIISDNSLPNPQHSVVNAYNVYD